MLLLFCIHSVHTSGVRDCKKSTVKERPDGIIDPTKFNILSGQPACSPLDQPPSLRPNQIQYTLWPVPAGSAARPRPLFDPTKFNILSASPCCPRWISRPLFDPTEFSILGGRPACPADVPYFEMFLILSFTLGS